MRLVIAAISALFLLPSSGFAQTLATRQWDSAVTFGLFNAWPTSDQQLDYGDDWYHSGEIRWSVGRLWTERIKTEFELGTTGEGSRYVTRFTDSLAPYGAREFYRVHQGTAKLTWQFLDNSWVQPYLSAGVLVEAEQRSAHVFERYALQGTTSRIVAPAYDEPSHTDFHPGAHFGAGAKFYMSQHAFFKAGAQSTLTYQSASANAPARRASSSVAFLAGFGFDF